MYIEIDKRIVELNDSQAFVYMMIVYNKFQHRQINRQYLASALGVTNKEYISEIITAIVNAGLLKRKNYTAHTYNQGWIDVKLDWELNYEDSYKVSIDFVRDRNITPKVKGFALRYRCLAEYSFETNLNKKELAIRLNVSRPTLNKYLSLINDTQTYFFKDKQIKEELTKDEIDLLKRFASTECVDGKIKECCKWFLEKNLQSRNNCRQLFNRAVSGTLFKNKQVNEESDSRYSLGN